MNSTTPTAPRVKSVTLEQLAEDYEFVGCDHTEACCDTHRTHTTPHMGCLFR